MIDRSEERIKQTGEVFTPAKLVDEILNKLPSEVFTDLTKTFIDPACGEGAFLEQVVMRKILDGKSTVWQALATTFGVDIMPDNIDTCRERVLKYAAEASGELITDKHRRIVEHNIVCADSLKEWDFDNWCYKVNPDD